jgi:hypothetical protein
MSKNDYAFALRWAKKLRAINLLGGKCTVCGNSDWRVLDFHHVGRKTNRVGFMFGGSRWSHIEEEINSCSLLCRNCHKEMHSTCARQNTEKVRILGLADYDIWCKVCGYRGKTLASLSFHHRNPEDKHFLVSSAICRNVKVSLEDLLAEIEKCDLLCSNCHQIGHLNVSKLEEFTDVINDMARVYREPQKPVDCNVVVKMAESGMMQKDIAKQLGYSKSTISEAVSRTRRYSSIG